MSRPKEDISSLPEEWYNTVLKMYSEGASDVEVKAWIYDVRGSISNDLWERWIKEEPQFSETIKTGKLLSEAWWSKQGRTNLKVKEFNFVGWYMNMKNRFGWKDKQEIDQNVKGSLNIRFAEPEEYKRVYPTQDQGNIGDLDSDQ